MQAKIFPTAENYSHEIFNSAMDVPAEDWLQLTNPEQDVAMDQRLIYLMEQTLADQATFYTVVVRDATHRIVACAVLSIFYADIIQSASPVFLKIMRKIRLHWPNALKWKILFCGLPVPSGHSHLRFSNEVEVKPVLSYLNRVVQQFAKKHGAQMMVFKELDAFQSQQLESLKAWGFHRGELAPLFIMPGAFKNFADYEAAVRANYRRQIQANVKKFSQAQLTVEHIFSPEEIAEKYTHEVHQLYLNIWDRAKEKLECFSADFFRRLAFAMPGKVAFTLISKGEKPVAFAMGLLGEDMYYNLYAGMDYDLKDESDLYFNLFYHELDCAFGFNKKAISLGQTSEQFKLRLGATASPRYFYVKAMNPIMRFGLRMFHKYIFPKLPKMEEKKVFKAD